MHDSHSPKRNLPDNHPTPPAVSKKCAYSGIARHMTGRVKRLIVSRANVSTELACGSATPPPTRAFVTAPNLHLNELKVVTGYHSNSSACSINGDGRRVQTAELRPKNPVTSNFRRFTDVETDLRIARRCRATDGNDD